MRMPIVVNTPIDFYSGVFVKRDDLACTNPGPPFAKIRGLYHTLLELESQKVPAVGYMDTTISMAGWGISYLCHELKLKIKPVVYWPSYKDGLLRHNLSNHIPRWHEFGADIVSIQASKLSIMRAMAKHDLQERYPGAYMLPQGLPSEYTIQAVAKEVATVPTGLLTGSIVMCLGSGVMAAGVLRGLAHTLAAPKVFGVLVAPKNHGVMYKKILQYSRLSDGGFFDRLSAELKIVDNGYVYHEPLSITAPFPCNKYYDLKAWAWLMENIKDLPKPILFWNIGGDGEENTGNS